MTKIIIAGGLALAMAITAASAHAQSGVPGPQGNTSSYCYDLYRNRNALYDQKGWCMRGVVVRRLFPDNSQTCVYTRWDDVPFSAAERRYYRSIIAEERSLGCAVPP